VKFLDLMPKTELRAILGDADIGLHVVADVPVFKLGMSPNKLYDYLAAGLPVVTNATGEPHRIVHDADAGVGIETHQLAVGIKKLLDTDDVELSRLRRNAREYMRATKSPDVTSRRLQSLLDAIAPPGERSVVRSRRKDGWCLSKDATIYTTNVGVEQ